MRRIVLQCTLELLSGLKEPPAYCLTRLQLLGTKRSSQEIFLCVGWGGINSRVVSL